jgi:WD40 repeat protein
MRILVPGLLVVILSALGSGCVFNDDRELFAESIAAEKKANAFTALLSSEGGESRVGELPMVAPDGPRIESFEMLGQVVVVPNEATDIDVHFVFPADQAADVAAILFQADSASTHLRVPVEVDPETGFVDVTLRLEALEEPTKWANEGWFMPESSAGAYGEPLRVRLILVTKEPPGGSKQVRTYADHFGATRAVTLGPGGDGGPRMVTGGNDDELALWDVDTGHELRRFVGHTGWVLSADMTMAGDRIVSGGRDNTVRIWDAATGSLLHTYGDHLGRVTAVQILKPLEKLFISGSWDHTLKVRNWETGEVLKTLDVGDRVNAVAHSALSNRLAVGAGRLLHPGRVLLWESNSWTGDLTVLDLDREVTALAFSADGARLAAASGRGVIYIWDVESGELMHTLGADSTVTGHAVEPPRDTLPSLDFWPGNDDVLAAVSLTGVIALWKLSEERIFVGTTMDQSLTAVRFAPFGFRLLMGGSDGRTLVTGIEALPGGGG